MFKRLKEKWKNDVYTYITDIERPNKNVESWNIVKLFFHARTCRKLVK